MIDEQTGQRLTRRHSTERAQAMARVLSVVFSLSGAACAWLVGTPAFAETAVMLPHQGHKDLAPTVFETAEHAVRDRLASDGARLVESSSVHKRMPEEKLAACDDACVTQLLKSLRADLAVRLTVWGKPVTLGSTATKVVVALTGKDGVTFTGSELIAGGDVGKAAMDAYQAARSNRAAGPGPWIRVKGTPVGARVRIDGKDAGPMPAKQKVAPGDHDVVVTLEGYGTQRKRVSMPANPGHEELVQVALHRPGERLPAVASTDAASSSPSNVAASGASSSTSAPSNPVAPIGEEKQPSALNYVAAGVLAAGALAVAISPVRTLADSGSCGKDVDQDGLCEERVHFGTRSWLQTGISVLLLGGAAAVLWLKPFRVSVDPKGSAMLQLQGRF